MPVTDIHMSWASAWGCWRCGGTFSGSIPNEATVTSATGDWRATAPICEGCMRHANGYSFNWALPLISHMCNGQHVHWRLRFRLAWRIFRGTFHEPIQQEAA